MQKVLLPPGQPVVLFTDLDGTLIDHHSYSADSASAALQQLKARAWPLVFCSSKTFSEQLFLQQQLGIHGPMILENGSAVAIPEGYFAALPPNPIRRDGFEVYALAHAGFAEARAEIAHIPGVQGFSDISDAELTAATGLQGDALARARDRWFTETLVTPLDAEQGLFLASKLLKNGWVLSKGGRFHTLLSAQADKGRAMRWLADVFQDNLPIAPVLVAIGDSPNDFPMLETADFPFLVQRHDGTWAELELPHLNRVAGIGPKGFSTVIQMLGT